MCEGAIATVVVATEKNSFNVFTKPWCFCYTPQRILLHQHNFHFHKPLCDLVELIGGQQYRGLCSSKTLFLQLFLNESIVTTT